MYDFNFYIGRPGQLTDEAYWRAVDNSIKLESQEAKDARATQVASTKLREQYLQDLNSLIGDANLKKYLAARHSYREAIHSASARQPPPDAGALEEIKRQGRAKSMQVLNKLGIDTKKIKSLQGRYKQKCSALSPSDLTDELPAGANRKRPSKNQTYHPIPDGAGQGPGMNPVNGWPTRFTSGGLRSIPVKSAIER